MSTNTTLFDWADMPDATRNLYRDQARAMLTALRADAERAR